MCLRQATKKNVSGKLKKLLCRLQAVRLEWCDESWGRPQQKNTGYCRCFMLLVFVVISRWLQSKQSRDGFCSNGRQRRLRLRVAGLPSVRRSRRNRGGHCPSSPHQPKHGGAMVRAGGGVLQPLRGMDGCVLQFERAIM